MKNGHDNNITSYKKKYLLIVVSVLMTMLIACGSSASPMAVSSSKDTGFVVTKAGMYDSADTDTLLIAKDPENKTVTFYNRKIGRDYTLNYDGTSKIYDKYGTAMSMEQVQVGSIVDITFLKGKKILNSMQGSKNAWTLTQVRDFSINELNGKVYASGGDYRFDDSIAVYADGQKAMLMDINPVDTITVSGVDRMAYSISIDEGHGYLRLKNEDYFVGGWIEVGSKIIRTIGEDMIIAVPVGTYDVNLSNKGVEGVKTVSIDRNRETELDIGDLKTEELTTYGNIVFVVTPATAEVYVDGEIVDITRPVSVEYGIHQLIAKAPGYQTLTQYIKVGQENATLEVTLDPIKEPAGEEEYISATSGVVPSPSPIPSPTPYPTSAPSTDIVSTAISGYKITVSSPAGAEVYVDGIYTGIAPISFAKVSGRHEIILRKEGYVTRSYTLAIDTEQRDEVFSFSELVPTGENENKIVPANVTPIPTVFLTPTPADITGSVTPTTDPDPVLTPTPVPEPTVGPSPEPVPTPVPTEQVQPTPEPTSSPEENNTVTASVTGASSGNSETGTNEESGENGQTVTPAGQD